MNTQGHWFTSLTTLKSISFFLEGKKKKDFCNAYAMLLLNKFKIKTMN